MACSICCDQVFFQFQHTCTKEFLAHRGHAQLPVVQLVGQGVWDMVWNGRLKKLWKWFQPGFQKQLECRISVELGSSTEFKRGHLKVTSLSSFVIVFCCTSIEFEHWTGFNLPQWTCRTWLIVDQADQAFFFPVSFWFDLLSQMIYIWKCLPDPGLQFIKATFEPSRQLNDLGVLVDSGKIDEWNDELPDA